VVTLDGLESVSDLGEARFDPLEHPRAPGCPPLRTRLPEQVAGDQDIGEVALRPVEPTRTRSNAREKVSMTQGLYLGRRLTARQTSEVLDGMFEDR
jgi:hypothetical protein